MGPLPNFPDPVTRPMSLGNYTSWNSAMKGTTYSRQQTSIDTTIERGDPPVRVNLRVTQVPSGGGPVGAERRQGTVGTRQEAAQRKPEAPGVAGTPPEAPEEPPEDARRPPGAAKRSPGGRPVRPGVAGRPPRAPPGTTRSPESIGFA